MMVIVFFWFAIAVVSAIVAKNRDRSVIGWFLTALMISPLALILLLVLPPVSGLPLVIEDPQIEEDGMKVCPRCAESIQARAYICRYCGVEFDNIEEKKLLRKQREREGNRNFLLIFVAVPSVLVLGGLAWPFIIGVFGLK